MLSKQCDLNVVYISQLFNKSQQEIHDLTQMNEKMRKKIEELNQKCEQAQVDYIILKSVDLSTREEL